MNALIEAGDPIIHDSKTSLLIKDFSEMEDDPWEFIEKNNEEFFKYDLD